MQVDDSEAEALVGELQTRRLAGDGDLDLITYLCNRYRIGKPTARDLYDRFYRGFADGADSNFDDSKQLAPGVVMQDTLYARAFQLGRASFQQEMAKRMPSRNRAGCLAMLALAAFAVSVAALSKVHGAAQQRVEADEAEPE